MLVRDFQIGEQRLDRKLNRGWEIDEQRLVR
jgi:hypothetical protein